MDADLCLKRVKLSYSLQLLSTLLESSRKRRRDEMKQKQRRCSSSELSRAGDIPELVCKSYEAVEADPSEV